MNAALERNAFRVLSLPADAELREVYRQQQRIQNALELGDTDVGLGFAFLPRLPLSPEMVLDAVHRLEKQRPTEELFWLHSLGGKFDFSSGGIDNALSSLRADAAQNTTRGAVAQHNLAVILTCLAQSLNGSRRFEYWKDAVQAWAKTLGNDVFWQFMLDRDDRPNGDIGPAALNGLRDAANNAIQRAVVDEVWSAVDRRDYSAVARLSTILRTYPRLLDAGGTLNAIGNRMAKDASVAVGAVLDRLTAVRDGTDKSVVCRELIQAEKDLRKIGSDFDEVIRAFGQPESFNGVYDARALAWKQLSIAYFNVVNDEPEALRMVMEARSLVRDAKLKDEVEAGWTHIRRALICSEALALVEAKNYAAAEEKFAVALTLSTEEQRTEIQEMQEGVHRARVFRDVDLNQKNPSLFTFNGIGARFYGKRAFDAKTATYVTIHWLVVLFLPIIPLACYRVSDAGANRWTIYGRVPLTPFLRKYRWAAVAAIAILIIIGIINSSDSSSIRSTYAPSTPTSSTSEPQTAEKDGIETERAELKRLSDSLDLQKQKLDDDSAELERMESYIHSVDDSYTAENVPEEIRTRYNEVIDDYNAKAPAYNIAVRSYNADLQQYKQRVAAFNQRVERYNANR